MAEFIYLSTILMTMYKDIILRLDSINKYMFMVVTHKYISISWSPLKKQDAQNFLIQNLSIW